MNKMISILTLGALLTRTQIIQQNHTQNNLIHFNNDNQVNGTSNQIAGYDNNIKGNILCINHVGDLNNILGDANNLFSSNNFIQGDSNLIKTFSNSLNNDIFNDFDSKFSQMKNGRMGNFGRDIDVSIPDKTKALITDNQQISQIYHHNNDLMSLDTKLKMVLQNQLKNIQTGQKYQTNDVNDQIRESMLRSAKDPRQIEAIKSSDISLPSSAKRIWVVEYRKYKIVHH